MTVALTLFTLLSGPTVASTPQSVLQDVTSPLTKNWNSADLPEGAIVFNNLEDFIDQLSDLHNESDIGTHSNPATLQVLDGVYDTLTSDNITISGQWIEDPLNETPPYWKPAYESWQLDLEGAWTDVVFDEISAELCVFGGTQAEESLKVDIWNNDGWLNVISDVIPGWNNVSIAPSLVDKSLEVRFTGSNSGNTSVQSSWEIDAILLHTWTTVYRSEFTQNGITQDLGNNLSRYIASIGETNTWNEETDTWHRYLYDPDAKVVQIGNLTITHLPGGALSIDGDAGSRIGKLSWYIQAYYADQWNNITLDNYQFIGFTKTADNVTAHQQFWGTQGEMNVYLTYSYFGGFKTRVDIRNDAAQAVPIRAIWAAREVSGIQDNYELLHDENGVLYGIQIEDATFSWYDVLVSDNPLPTQTVIDKPNRRAAVVFGNQSTIIPAGYTATIDPTYSVAADADDNYWDTFNDPLPFRYDSATDDKIGKSGTSYSYETTFRVPLTIVPYSVVTVAFVTVEISAYSGTSAVTVKRIDALSAAVLEGGDFPDIDETPTGTILFNLEGPRSTGNIGDMVQEQINQAGWTGSSQYMGFKLEPTGDCTHTIEDYQKGGTPASLSVTYFAPSGDWLTGYTYRQGHSIDGSTGAGTYYQTKVHVEYGIGTSSGGTIYCNEHCDIDFDDIRFTNAGGGDEDELDYWMEEKTDSDDATFWVEVDADLGSDQVIYCYYGKADDSTTSSGTDTFLFFDDFENNNLNRWTSVGDNWGTTSAQAQYGTYSMMGDADSTGRETYKTMTATTNVMIHAWIRMDTEKGYFFMPRDEGDVFVYSMVIQGDDFDYYNGAWGEWASPANDDTWYRAEIGYDFSGADQYCWIDRVSKGSADLKDEGGNAVTSLTKFGMLTWTTAGYDMFLDDYYVRKWLVTEPAHYTWTVEHEKPNNVPVNDVAPECTNLDDGNNLYARYKIYEFSVSVTDADGFADIDYVELRSYDTGTTTLRWTVRFDEDTATFSEQGTPTQKDYIELTGSTNISSGVNLDITFKLYIEFAHPDANADDLYQYVVDDKPESDADSYPATDYDYDTDLVTTFGLNDGSGTVDRGNYDSVDSITASGVLTYEDSGGSKYPPSDKVDVYIRCSDVAGSDWNTGISGSWSMTVDSDDVVGLDTYYVKAVQEGGNYDSASLLASVTSDTYIADKVVIQTTVVDDGRVNINANAEVRVTASLAYTTGGTVWLGSGDSITLDGVSMNWDASNSWFDLTRSQAMGGLWNYEVEAASETGHGVTALDTNSQSVDVIWDRIRAIGLSYGGDTRINAGTSVNFDYELHYDYDETDVTDGTIIINGESFTHQGSGVWRHTTSNGGAVGDITFDSIVASGNTHGITLTTTDGNDVTLIWDKVRVVSYTIVSPAGDNRNNIGTTYTIDIELHYDFDETDLADGTITVNGEAMDSYQGSGKWRWTPYQAGVTGITYNNMQATGNTHGITVEDNTITQLIIWDRIQVQSYSLDDSRININEVGWGDVTLWYDYDDTLVIDGTVTVNSLGTSHEGSGVWAFGESDSAVGSHSYNEVAVTGNTHGITAVDQNGQSITQIWDRIQVQSYSVSDPRDDINDNVNIDATLWYDYDDTQLTDGTVTINGYDAAHQGSGVWRITRTSATVTSVTYNTVAASGNTHGITVVDQNGQSQQVIWDRVQVQSYSSDDPRIDINTEAGDHVTLWYDYDDTIVTDGTVTANGVSAVYSGASGIWDFGETKASVQGVTYNDVQCSGNTHGITIEDQNGQSLLQIWDRIQVQSYSVSDPRDDINDNVNIDATLWYDYDDTLVTDGTVTINGYSAAHQGSGVWRITRTSATVTSVTYNTVAAASNTHGITSVDQNGQSQQVIWDQVVFAFAVNMTWTVIGYYANVSWTAIYDFDDDPYLGTEVVNNDGGILTFSTVGNRTFYVTSMDDSAGYDLTEFTTNTVWCVWDDVVPSGAVAHSWMQYSATQVYLIWGIGSNWKWDYNDTLLNVNVIFHAYSNSSTPEASGGTYGSGAFGGLTIGPYTPDWYYVDLAVNCEVSVSGIDYDWEIWDVILAVDILHSITIEDSGMDIQDVWITFIIHTNWANASFTIWDNDTLVGHSGNEGWYQVAKPAIVGLHNYTVLINGTHGLASEDGQTKDFTINDSWAWRNFKFTVNPVVLTITYGRLGVAYDEVSFSGTASKPADVTIYENDVQVGSTSVETGTFTFWWTRASAESAGNIRYQLKFVNGTTTVWENGSYAKVLITAFKVEQWWLSLQLGVESYVEFYVLTSWENATVYVYDNETLMTTVTESEGGVYSYFWMSETQGLHVVVLNITHGATVHTRTRTYYIPDWAVTGLVFRWDLWTFQDNYTMISLESNWRNCTFYVYLNSSLVATSYNDPVTLNFTRSINNGTYNLTIYADGGTQTYTISNIRYIVTEEGVSYDFSSFTGGRTVVEGDTYEGDVVTIHENPTGVFVDQETAAIVAVGSFLIFFTAYLVARELKQREREKTERTYSQ